MQILEENKGKSISQKWKRKKARNHGENLTTDYITIVFTKIKPEEKNKKKYNRGEGYSIVFSLKELQI